MLKLLETELRNNMFTEFIALATVLSLQFTAYTDILIIDIKNDALITLRITLKRSRKQTVYETQQLIILFQFRS